MNFVQIFNTLLIVFYYFCLIKYFNLIYPVITPLIIKYKSYFFFNTYTILIDHLLHSNYII